MADTVQAPQVPDIKTQIPQGPSADIQAQIDKIQNAATAPLPPQYIQGSAPVSHNVRELNPIAPRQEVQAQNSTAVAQKTARDANGIGAILHLVGAAAQQHAIQKQDVLKTKILDVLQAQKQVASAKQVLAQDPNNKIAQQVMAANEKRLKEIFSDPKNAKQLQKAFDVSFTDPEKNKKPEVMAAQAAYKEFKSNGAFNAQNPQEAAVDKAAQQLDPKGGSDNGAPKPQAAQSQQAQPQQQAPASRPQLSQTPYADRLSTPTLEVNPQYTAALEKQQAAAKAMEQYILPRMVTADAQRSIQAAKDGSAAEREKYKDISAYYKDAMNNLSKANIADATQKAAMQRTVARNSNAMQIAQAHINSAEKIASQKDLTTSQKQSVAKAAKDDLEKQISTATTVLKSYGQREADIRANNSLSSDEQKQQLEALAQQKQSDNALLTYLQKLQKDKFGIKDPAAPPAEPEPKSWFQRTYEEIHGDNNAGSSTAAKPASNTNPANAPAATNTPAIIPVGASGSDESNEDPNDPDNSDGLGGDN